MLLCRTECNINNNRCDFWKLIIFHLCKHYKNFQYKSCDFRHRGQGQIYSLDELLGNH